jgi:hypothetical protein
MKLNEKVSVVKLLIQFLTRYSHRRDHLQCMCKNIQKWNHVLDHFSRHSSNGIIDYSFFTSFDYWKSSYFIESLSGKKKFEIDYLVFSSYLNQIIRGKDFKIFEVNDPKLKSLFISILRYSDNSGKCILPKLSSFYKELIELCDEKNFRSLRPHLIDIKKENNQIILVAKSKVNWVDIGPCPFEMFSLAASFEKHFNEFPGEENRNILFQLKCLARLEDFMIDQYALDTCVKRVLL